MAKKIVNSDIYNLSQLVDDVKSVFIPEETDETLAIGTYGYIGALEAHRLQTQAQMTGELCNEVFPSRARLNRNVITHAIMTNINDINAVPAKMTAFLAIREADILDHFDENHYFTIDRECPIFIGDFEFHLEYDIKLKKIYIAKKATNTYTAQYDIPPERDVPTSTINSTTQYLSPPAVVMVNHDPYIYITVVLAQVEHNVKSKKLVTSNIIDNKTINFEFENQLAYFEIHSKESDNDYYITPVFEGSAVPESNAKYYCWYQYIDTNLIRVRFDRHSYMPGLNATVECLIKTCQGERGNFTYSEDTYIEIESKRFGYKGITCLLTPISNSDGGKDRKSKKELQSLIPKEALSRGSLTTITDLNNYFSMLDSEFGRIVIQKKIDNQIERVYYAYFVAKDRNGDVIPSNTVDVEIDLKDMIKSQITETDAPRYLLPSGECFRLDEDGVARINKYPILDLGYKFKPDPVPRGEIVEARFTVRVNEDAEKVDQVSCGVDVGGSPTRTHLFPAPIGDENRYLANKSKVNSIVEDYLQMGFGKLYTYLTEYVTQQDNSLITAEDMHLDCFDIDDAFYTANGVTRHFNKLPILAYGLPANTKITFGIRHRLNIYAKGIITFANEVDETIYKLHQKWEVKLSTVLKKFGVLGDVKLAISGDESIVKLTEDGTIEVPVLPPIEPETPDPIIPPDPGGDEKPEKPDPSDPPVIITDPYKRKVVGCQEIPPVEKRIKNEWYWVVTNKGTVTSSEETVIISGADGQEEVLTPVKDPYTLHVLEEADLPAIADRKTNEWFYIVTDRGDTDTRLIPFKASSDKHRVHVVTEDNLPPIEERETEDDWYIVVTDREVIDDKEPDPDPEPGPDPDPGPDPGPDPEPEPEPGPPTVLTGKDYKINILKNFNEPVTITVSVEDYEYKINLTQDCFNVENGIIVCENKEETHRKIYTTYVPTLEQDKWPDELVVGDLINYVLRYKSSSNTYSPDIIIKLSRGLEYVPFSNNVYYPPNKPPIMYEPEEESLDAERGFLYTNPYAVNVNGYRLYSAFYMMSMTENPYLHFEYINEKSNVQFISTNIHWSRPFYDEKNRYTLSMKLIQSVQDNIGLIRSSTNDINTISTIDQETTPLVKAVAVFYRNNKPYRYRSLKLDSFDPDKFEFNFSQTFESADIFDNENNIKIMNAQVTGQIEYKTIFTYGDRKFTMLNGEMCSLNVILRELGIEIEQIIEAFSSDRKCVELYPIVSEGNFGNPSDYDVISFTDLESPGFIAVKHINDTEPIIIKMESTHLNRTTEYGFFNPNSTLKIFTYCGVPDVNDEYSIEYKDSVCPELNLKNSKWTLTNVFNVVNGVTLYHNYSEIMGSRVIPYGQNYVDENNNVVMKLEGFKLRTIPMLGYDYCQSEEMVQHAIDALNYRKAYIDNAMIILENSFGIDFKLFNTYGPSKTFYIIRDNDKNGYLDDAYEYIDRVNISLYFRIKLVARNDHYTKDSIINDIKAYVEDLDDLGQLHIPNLVTQITSNYKEQVSYFEYLGFNDYGAGVQHIYKMDDDYIPIHTAPEFLCVNNVLDVDGIAKPDINIFISEI